MQRSQLSREKVMAPNFHNTVMSFRSQKEILQAMKIRKKIGIKENHGVNQNVNDINAHYWVVDMV